VELLTAACFGAVVAARGFDNDLWLELPFVACLIALAGIDLDHKLLPNKIVYPMAVYGLVMSALVQWDVFPEHLIAGTGAFAFLLVAVLAYPSGMGMGDVKLAGAMGLYLGVSVVPALLAAFLTGTIFGLGVIAREGARACRSARRAGPDRLLRDDLSELSEWDSRDSVPAPISGENRHGVFPPKDF
jgi:leader peptidase (prepilin peptidase) / N-methyltransferase